MTKGTIVLLLLGLFAASGVYGTRNAPSRMLAVEGPPVRFLDCEHKFGPWPPTIPKGSSGWQDGQHGNMSTFLISFTNTGIKGIQTKWVSFLTADQTTPSFVTFTHGTVTGTQKATFTWKVKDPTNTPFVRLGGSYNTKYGLDTLSFIDSNNNQYTWGNYQKPGPKSFFSPAGQGYVVGLFGANNKTHLTQIGVCMSGPK
ncbi:hypothetical protein M758_4G092900 [Ceratodon purpureus]|uniref:Jacalin-type lectin domain-containing protein n=1 Tax=Ceratodon purpureus TaxID=3225 RepID=A0A8T0I8J1_CERPU|nr:hypothetical protein KC19_4G092300 [Ceratodon purpureus]KAG0618810.1 hypothetical protein M758_4G092900 [Ceratodon purpureus]